MKNFIIWMIGGYFLFSNYEWFVASTIDIIHSINDIFLSSENFGYKLLVILISVFYFYIICERI
jgi:hypothetical protein